MCEKLINSANRFSGGNYIFVGAMCGYCTQVITASHNIVLSCYTHMYVPMVTKGHLQGRLPFSPVSLSPLVIWCTSLHSSIGRKPSTRVLNACT